MKTLLLGLDGADPALVEEFDLPHIESIGDSWQTIETHGNSGPSWASVLTGLRPRGHGVYKLEPQQDAQSWEGIPFWQKVDGYTGVANVPLTYPPTAHDIDGWLVSGLFTPRKAIYTQPRDLYKALDERGYRTDMWVENHRNHPNGHYGTVPFEFTQEYRDELLAELRDVLDARGRCFSWLVEHRPVDCAFLCFTTLDRVQHLAFDDRDIVRAFYERADEQVGRVLDAVGDDVEVFVTSDHGFQRIDQPGADITGEHRVPGSFRCSSGLDVEPSTLEDVHEAVVVSANRTRVADRLDDLGYV